MSEDLEDSVEELPPDKTGEANPDKDSTGNAEGDKKLEKRLKDTQAAFTRKSQENADLRRELDEMKGKLDAVIQLRGDKGENKEPDPLSFLDDPKQVETLLDDPANIANGLKTVVGVIGRTFESRDKALLKAVKEMIVNTGIRTPVAEKVAELKKDVAYQGLTEDVLEKIALNQITAESKRTKDEDTEEDGGTQFRGAPAGGRRFSRAGGGKGESDVEKLAKEYFKRLYKDDYKEDK